MDLFPSLGDYRFFLYFYLLLVDMVGPKKVPETDKKNFKELTVFK